jgi:pilus assembly protein CpaB
MQKRSGCIWIVAGVIVAVLAGVLTFGVLLQTANKTSTPLQQGPTVKVVVASRSLGVRELLQTGDIELRSAPADVVPEATLRKLEDALGQITTVPLARGEMILSTHIVSPTIKGADFAWTMDEGKVAMAFPAGDLMTRQGLLKPGDHVDLLFSIEIQAREQGSGGLVTFNALQNLEIATIVQPENLGTKAAGSTTGDESRPQAIIFALDPQDALVLKHLKDRGGTVDIVLRAPGVEERFTTQPVNINHLMDLYQLRVPELP